MGSLLMVVENVILLISILCCLLKLLKRLPFGRLLICLFSIEGKNLKALLDFVVFVVKFVS
jgi:hypothetical protein